MESTQSGQEQWARDMRLKFSPTAMLSAEGEINQEFFKPTKVVILDGKKWGAEELDLLYKGIEQFGVGKWKEISESFLPSWDEQFLRRKTARLLGVQSLERYDGWKGDRQAVQTEVEQNKLVAESTQRGISVLGTDNSNEAIKVL